MLIEFHVLQNHAPSNLNRDDTGSPKECVFGGVKRARISSQCLKRSIRRSDTFQQELAGHLATRTRRLPELMRQRFQNEGLGDEMAEVAAKKSSGFGTSDGKEQTLPKDYKPGDEVIYSTRQTMFLTSHDIEAVAKVLLEAARKAGDAKKFGALKAADLQAEARQKGFRPVSVDVALFGRMTTSEAFRDVEAAMQVAHALSTHKVDHEFDYFTAVDDLKNSDGDIEEDAGADMLGDVEYNSACYYKYFSLDVDGLIANLSGSARREVGDAEKLEARALASRAVDAFVRAMTLTTPSGKQNSFAAHQLPAAILVEVRPHAAPVSYANAFTNEVRPGQNAKEVREATGKNPDLVSVSLVSLKKHVEALTNGFNLESKHRWLLVPEYGEFEQDGKKSRFDIEGVERCASLNALCEQLKSAIESDIGHNDGGRDG
jgi:CRISPR system Cascade subunit CasC